MCGQPGRVGSPGGWAAPSFLVFLTGTQRSGGEATLPIMWIVTVKISKVRAGEMARQWLLFQRS